MIIQDPSNAQGAFVDSQGRLRTLAATRPSIVEAAHLGQALALHSTYSATTADEVISFKNEDPTEFHVHGLLVGADTAGSLTLAVTTGTAAGTSLTGLSLNQGRIITKLFSAYGNAAVTGLTPGIAFAQPFVPANGSIFLPVNGSIILGNSDQICVTTNVTAIVAVSLYGYWSDE